MPPAFCEVTVLAQTDKGVLSQPRFRLVQKRHPYPRIGPLRGLPFITA
jgi:hypothetical protein